jgi:fatty acid desaturase
VQLQIALLAGSAGIRLFYVQRQFQGVYWACFEELDPRRVAMEGTSFYKLPKLLQWATGNIGFHHLHHVRPAIPNYNLQACQEAIPALQAVKPICLRDSLQCAGLTLYDEQRHQMISFRPFSRGGKPVLVETAWVFWPSPVKNRAQCSVIIRQLGNLLSCLEGRPAAFRTSIVAGLASSFNIEC